MTISDNTSNVDYKPLETLQWDLDLRGYVRTRNTSVPHATALVAFSHGVVESRIENQTNVHKSRKIVAETTTQSTVVDKKLGTAWGELQDYAPSWTVTKDMVSTSSVPTSGFLVVMGENNEHNPSNFKQDVITVPSWSTRVTKVWDEEFGKQVTITRTVVAAGTSVPSTTTASWSIQRQVDDERAIQETTAFVGGAGSGDRTYYDTVNMSWPALFESYDKDNAFEEQQRRSIFQFTPNIRAAFSGPCNARVVETLITESDMTTLVSSTPSGAGSSTVRAALWLPKTRDLVYQGYLFNLNIPNVITNAHSIPATTNSEDTYYGYPITDTFYGLASSPDYTAYLALIGTEVCIEDSVRPSKGGLWMRKRVYVKVQ